MEKQEIPHKNQTGKRKRKRSLQEDPLQLAYRNVKITPRTSSGRPGSPHRFFKSSHDVSIQVPVDKQASATGTKGESADTSEMQQNVYASCVNQVVHQHANGLCIVTVGDLCREEVVEKIEFVAKEAPNNMSAAERRKRQSKMLHRSSALSEEAGIATPTGVLAKIKFKSGKSQEIIGGVWGHILELNRRLTPELLNKDPLLDGYLAVVLPTGPFPPPSLQDEKCEKEETAAAAEIKETC